MMLSDNTGESTGIGITEWNISVDEKNYKYEIKYDIIDDIFPGKSEKEVGLQIIDNICSVVRLHKSGDEKDRFFDSIKGMIKEVRRFIDMVLL